MFGGRNMNGAPFKSTYILVNYSSFYCCSLSAIACDKTTRHVLRNTVISSWTRGEPIKNGTAIKAFYSRVNIKDFSIAKININWDWHHKSFGGLFTISIVHPTTNRRYVRALQEKYITANAIRSAVIDRQRDRSIDREWLRWTTILLVSRWKVV